MRIALDAMGGDYAPAEVVQGAVLFARENPQHEVVLVGHQRRIHEALREELAAPGHIEVHHASETVEMHEHPSAAIRGKRDSSIRVCFELIKAGEAAAMVSAGNSGAVMAGALLVLGRIPSIDRPAFAALFPALKGEGRCLLLDAGANVECKPAHLAQFALMGEVYVRRLLGVHRPRVAILSNGEETSKGTPLTRSALDLLRHSDLHLLGYVEGKDIFSGEVEVVVTDGFTGNVVLKTSEGAATAVAGLIRSAVQQAGLSEKLGALLLKPTLAGLRKVVDYAEYGGAPVLGVAGVAIVAHGRSHARAVKNALRTAMQACDAHFNDELGLRLRSAQSWLPARAAKRIKGSTGTLEDASE